MWNSLLVGVFRSLVTGILLRSILMNLKGHAKMSSGALRLQRMFPDYERMHDCIDAACDEIENLRAAIATPEVYAGVVTAVLELELQRALRSLVDMDKKLRQPLWRIVLCRIKTIVSSILKI